MHEQLEGRIAQHLRRLCDDHPDRHVGGPGNRAATAMFREVAESFGFSVTTVELPCIEWEAEGAGITIGGDDLQLHAGPYSLACDVIAPLACAEMLDELESGSFTDTVLLLRGDLAREHLMPKRFTFYNPERHRRIIAALERHAPAAIIGATGIDPALSGGASPFPLIEDGDFDIPHCFTTEETGRRLAAHAGSEASLRIRSRRIRGLAQQPVAIKAGAGARRVLFTAHIDSKDGSPGALDNATGVAALLGMMELMAGYDGALTLEVVPFNGEDYYAVTGQMHYLAQNEGRWGDVVVGVNVDGAGYVGARTAVSTYSVPEPVGAAVKAATEANGFVEGPQWPQGDHSLLVLNGVPAVAVTSENAFFIAETVAHTDRDTTDVVDPGTVARVARFLADVVFEIEKRGDA